MASGQATRRKRKRPPGPPEASSGVGAPARRGSASPGQQRVDVPWTISGTGPEVMRGKLSRLIAGIGMPAINIASGLLFGGISLYFGYYVFIQWGVAASGGWKIAWPIPLGVLYGVYAILNGIAMLARLAWTWNAPLRNLRR